MECSLLASAAFQLRIRDVATLARAWPSRKLACLAHRLAPVATLKLGCSAALVLLATKNGRYRPCIKEIQNDKSEIGEYNGFIATLL